MESTYKSIAEMLACNMYVSRAKSLYNIVCKKVLFGGNIYYDVTFHYSIRDQHQYFTYNINLTKDLKKYLKRKMRGEKKTKKQ